MSKGQRRRRLTAWGRELGDIQPGTIAEYRPVKGEGAGWNGRDFSPEQYVRPVPHRPVRCRACRERIAEPGPDGLCEPCWVDRAARWFWGAPGFKIRDLAHYLGKRVTKIRRRP